MKRTLLKPSAFLLLFALMGAGCGKEGIQPLKDKTLNISSMKFIGCKETLKSTSVEQYIELKAIGTNKLQVKIINARLNCCPGNIYSSALIVNQTLKINFQEETPGKCNCLCYYDLECTIDSLEKGDYYTEVYVCSETPNAKFSFSYSVDLSKKIVISNN